MIFLMGLASADIPKGIQDRPYDISHSVRVSGFPTTTAACNVTVWNPNNLQIVSFAPMSFNTTARTFNYTIPSIQTNLVGQYNYDVTCIDGVFNATNSFSFEINPTGTAISTPQSLIYVITLLIVLFLFVLGLWASIKIPFNNVKNDEGDVVQINWKKYAKIGSMGVTYVLFTWIIFMAWNISYAYLNFQGMATAFNYLYRLLFALMLPGIPLVIIGGFWLYIKDKKFDQALQKELQWQ